MTSTSTIGDSMATVSFSDSDDSLKDVLLRSYLSLPLTPGQTITGSQAWSWVVRALETSTSNNLFVALRIVIVSADGNTVNKGMVAVKRDATEISAATLASRYDSGTTASGNYTTVTGDRFLIQVGAGGDPAAGFSHSFDIRLGDSASSDLSAADSVVIDDRPWVLLNDTLTFEPDGWQLDKWFAPPSLPVRLSPPPIGSDGASLMTEALSPPAPSVPDLVSSIYPSAIPGRPGLRDLSCYAKPVLPPESPAVAPQLDWRFSLPDFARDHAPRPHGGLSAAIPVRPDPTVDMWRFSPPDFAKQFPPRPHGGLFNPVLPPESPLVAPQMDWRYRPIDFARQHPPHPHGGSVSPIPDIDLQITAPSLVWRFSPPDFTRSLPPNTSGEATMTSLGTYADYITIAMWRFVPPDFAREPAPLTHGRVFATPLGSYPETIMLDKWRFVPPAFARIFPPRPHGGLTTTLCEPLTVDKWFNYLPPMTPMRDRLCESMAWYHSALHAPFTVDDFIHTDFLHAIWFSGAALEGSFQLLSSLDADFDSTPGVSAIQGLNQ